VARWLRYFRGAWALATLVLALFVLYESTRAEGDPTVPDVSTGAAYLGHFLFYAALGFSAQTAAFSRRAMVVLIVAAACATYGGAIEAYQSTLSGRESSILDGLANALGALTVSVLAAALLARWQRWLQQQAGEHKQQGG
jgi:VanZ family protein